MKRKVYKKVFFSILFGLLVCLGHWLARGALVYAANLKAKATEAVGQDENHRAPKTTESLQGEAKNKVAIESDTWWSLSAEQLNKMVGKAWKFLKLTVPRENNHVHFWRTLVLIALLISVFSATVLNSYFPDEYRDLGRKEMHTSLVQAIIPALQVLAAAVACATVEHFHIHSRATAIYLGLFVVWDVSILAAKNPGKQGEDFQEVVRGYLTRIDLPAFVPFLVLYAVAQWGADGVGGEGAEHFVAGVLCAQASAAVIAAGAVVVEDFKKRPHEEGTEPPSTPGAPTGQAPEPPLPAPA